MLHKVIISVLVTEHVAATAATVPSFYVAKTRLCEYHQDAIAHCKKHQEETAQKERIRKAKAAQKKAAEQKAYDQRKKAPKIRPPKSASINLQNCKRMQKNREARMQVKGIDDTYQTLTTIAVNEVEEKLAGSAIQNNLKKWFESSIGATGDKQCAGS